ncbi:MAG: peptidase S8, partial [Halanaerobiaceae bacterium]|nr:peptidase S8 [Halanaerobiaceae bacterium]
VYTAPLQTAQFRAQEYIINFKQRISKNELEENILKNKGQIIKQISENMYKVKLADEDQDFIYSLQKNPSIKYIEPEYLVHIQSIPDDPYYPEQWNLQRLALEKTWDNLKGRENINDITVAVIDTGILPQHPDLKDNIISGYDFIDDDNDPVDTSEDFSHGTHVAGIIGAVGNNGIGVTGINWNVKIMPVRVIGPDGSGEYSTLISGIHWAVDNGADIINLSLAGPVDSKALRDAVKYAVERKVTIVAAAGNNGSSPVLYPAQYPEVIGVGAVGPSNERAYYSNFGPGLDLVAPGGDNSLIDYSCNTILSTAGYISGDTIKYQYSWAQGSSMAAPHVSGIVSLLYSIGIDNPVDIKRILKETADDLGTEGIDDYYGAGLVNINNALKYPGHDYSRGEIYDDENNIIVLAKNNDNGEQKMVYADQSNYNFSISLSRGSWTLTAYYRDYSGQKTITVPGDNNIVIELK